MLSRSWSAADVDADVDGAVDVDDAPGTPAAHANGNVRTKARVNPKAQATERSLAMHIGTEAKANPK